MTLLLSCSICSASCANGGEVTTASGLAPAGARAARGDPVTWMPSAARKPAKAAAAAGAGVIVRGRRFPGSSASSGAPPRVSRPWSTSSELIGVTLPVVT